MRWPISIFINVLVVFGNLADEINKIDMERSDSAPGDTSVSSRRPKIAPLSAMLDLKADLEKHLMRIVGKSAIEPEAISVVTPDDAITAVPSPMKSPTSRNTAKTIPNHTNGVDESKLEPESWVTDFNILQAEVAGDQAEKKPLQQVDWNTQRGGRWE